ncbi:MAG: hypothetical protein MUE40_14510 [Anaerolineae bacterium]|nr:hypothetical protein [Anaerolineae bacterium]
MARLGLCLLVLMAALVVGSSLLSARSDPLTLRYGDTRSAIFTPDTPVQRWTFTAAAGEMVRLRGQRIGGQATPRLRLLDSAGTLLAESTAGAADAATLLYDSGFTVAGTYTVEVTATGLFVNPAENPDEYSLTLTRTGQRRARRDEGLTPLPAVTADLTTLESGTPAPALGLRVYGGATLERPDARNQPNRYLLTQGDWQIVLQNASPGPISSGVGSLSFTPAGIGLVTGNPRRPRAVLFTDQNFEIAYDTPNGIYTLRLANGQTIITDFYRIDSLIAREGLVLAQMTYTDPTGALLPRVGLFSGTLIDLRRRSGQAINEVPINEFRLENDQFIFTDFTRWDTLAYVAGQLRVLIGQDTRVLLRPVQAVLQTERGRPDFYELRLTHAGGTLRLLSDLQLMGDIAALDGTLTLARWTAAACANRWPPPSTC